MSNKGASIKLNAHTLKRIQTIWQIKLAKKIPHISQNRRNLHSISTIKADRYAPESDICQPIFQAERHICQHKLSPNLILAQFTPAFNQRLFDVKGETIGHTILIVDVLIIEVVQLRVVIAPTKRIAAPFRYLLNTNVALFHTLYQLTNTNDIIERRTLRSRLSRRTRHRGLAIAAKRAGHEYQERY